MTASKLSVIVLGLIALIIFAIGVLGLLFALRTTPRPGAPTAALPTGAIVVISATPAPTSPAPVSTTTAPSPLPPATATTVLPTPLPSFTLPARANGDLILAQRRDAPAVDGLLSDWTEWPYAAESPVFQPENWTGSGDLSVQYALAWDDTNLFLAAIVTDDAFVQTQRGEALFRGDSVELLFDADLPGDFASTSLNSDDFQIGFSPGTNGGEAAEAWLWFPRTIAGPPVNAVVAAQPTAQGYTLEVQIPWAVFGIRPAGGQRFGFALSASDNDTPGAAEQQSMVSSVNTRRLSDPTTWGTLELGR